MSDGARGARPSLGSPEGLANADEHRGQRTLDVPGLDPKDAHAVPREVRVSLTVAPLEADVGRAVDLDDEPGLGSKEVDDGGAEDDLAPELDAEPSGAECLPEDALRRGGVPPRVLRARDEEGAIVTKRRKEKTHGASVAARAPASCPPGADDVTAAKSRTRSLAEPLARRVRHGTQPALSPSRRAWGSGRTTGTLGRSVMHQVLPRVLGVVVTSVVTSYSAMADARPGPSAVGRAGERQEAPRVDEDLAPRHELCASPYPLAGFAHPTDHDGPRRSKAANGYWGRPTGGKKHTSGGEKAKGNPDDLDASGLFPAGRVGAPSALSAEGNKLYTEGNFEGARLKFMQALAVARTPSLLFNLARSEEKTGKLAEAYLHYQEYLKFPNLPAKGKADAERYASELEKKVGRIQIEAPAGSHVQVDGKDVGAAPFGGPVAVEVGAHQVMLGTETKPVACGAGTVVTVTFEAKPSVVVPPEKGPGPITPPPKEEMERGSWLVPGVLAGVGVVGLGVGGVMTAVASSSDSDGKALRSLGCSSPIACPQVQDAVDRTNAQSTVALIGYVAGTAFLGAAVVSALVIAPWKERPARTAQRIRLVPTLGGIGVVGRF